jgi:hypothetical protein
VRWIEVSTISSIFVVVALVACGGKTAAPRARLADHAIRAVDWDNRSYAKYTVVGGETALFYDAQDDEHTPAEWAARYPRTAPVARGRFAVLPPAYGDVDRDGSEDAVITTTIEAGGSGVFSMVELYVMRGGEAVSVAGIPGGDRADGGIAGVEVAANGEVRVERYQIDGGGACCPSATVVEVWTWNGQRLVEDTRRRGLPFPI